MNAPFKFETGHSAPPLDTPTPDDLTIIPRDRRFGRDEGTVQVRWWHGGNPYATAFYNALSTTFPKGEAFFIESVKAHRDGASPKLAEEIRAFTMQEIMHTREHVAFNRRVTDAGYDISFLDKQVDDILALVRERPPIINLAATMALEHFTAILARELLENPAHLEGADAESAELWRWHAVEEIEHKGVAYDTWLHATRDWSRWQRWKLKSLMMLVVTWRFIPERMTGMYDLLRQDGLTGWRAKAKMLRYAFAGPGMFRKIALPWVAYFLPGFHPWNADERHLIGAYISGAEAAA
ncbi:metal-dependent hydrolase [Sphingorhabdus sp.]|uniref:metal-dependent hydrolase n=1 Tax=Sphingorhabdus sp. TaxID=1902408 RepID=UPI003BB00FE7